MKTSALTQVHVCWFVTEFTQLLYTQNLNFYLTVNRQLSNYKDLKVNVANVCHSNCTKHIKTLCQQNSEGLKVNVGGTYSFH
jgi:hypothetical protein